MLLSIVGDILGSSIEFNPVKPNIENISLASLAIKGSLTDDSIMTLATWHWLQDFEKGVAKIEDYFQYQQNFFNQTPDIGYGPMFFKTMTNGKLTGRPSCGNGAAMKISPIGIANGDLGHVMDIAQKLTTQTHPHQDAINGAHAVVYAIWNLRKGVSKRAVMAEIEYLFRYDLDLNYEELLTRPFDATCQGSVPQALWCALTSNSIDEMFKKALTIGGDSDTIACIAGGVYESGIKKIRANANTDAAIAIGIGIAKLLNLGQMSEPFWHKMYGYGFDSEIFK